MAKIKYICTYCNHCVIREKWEFYSSCFICGDKNLEEHEEEKRDVYGYEDDEKHRSKIRRSKE